MKKKLMLIFVSAVAIVIAGCSGGDDGLTSDQRDTRDKFTQVLERSGGNWDKLTPEDRKWVVDSLANGNENAAKTMFQMRASRNPPTQTPTGGPKQ